MPDNTTALLERLALIRNLHRAAALLDWDMQTYMPPGTMCSQARGEQLAALTHVAHETFTSEITGRLLEAAEAENEGRGSEEDISTILSIARYDYDRQVKIPVKLASELSRHAAVSQDMWQRARQDNDFAAFAPYVQKSFELQTEVTERLGYDTERYDALLDGYERGARTAEVAEVFDGLKAPLIALTRAITESRKRTECSEPEIARLRCFPVDPQNALTLRIAEQLGYDLQHGRQDKTTHPFCTSFSRWDVRITTRFDESDIRPALYASLHEAGHAMYEQGMPADHDSDPIGDSASSGVHESQSRLWENMVGRSRPFAEYVTPLLRETFSTEYSDLTPEDFYRSVNQVTPSFIRVEADEVTYNLHILLRFEIERGLLQGSMEARDLPEIWNEKMREYLGIVPASDSVGVLQDVHWSAALVGYFPTYTLGNVMSGQLWQTIRQEVPGLDEKIRKGDFSEILAWLRSRIHEPGRRYLPGELIRRATGQPLSSKPYLDYLRTKYADLYALS